MFIPFVFSLDARTDLYYLWIFYKFLDMARRYKTPLIAQEKYFIDPQIYADMGKEEVCNIHWHHVNEYDRPLSGDMTETVKYPFPKDIEDKLISDKGSQTAAWMFLLSERYEPFEECIEKMLHNAASESSEKIEGILTFCHIPSLSYVADKLEIPVIHLEWGPLRTPNYRKTAYLDFKGIHGPNELETRYTVFESECKNNSINRYFTNKEILALFLDYGSIHNINIADQPAEYELGLATSYACDNNILINSSFMNDVEFITLARRYFKEDDLILRTHPGDPLQARYNIDNIDNSPSSMEFICKCKKIAVIHSNVAFEAMLLGRTAFVLGQSLYRFKALAKLTDNSEMQTDLQFLNYVVFGYLIPYELMLDVNYLRWRCTYPSELEIYNNHVMYYLKCRGIDSSILDTLPEHRLEKILNAQGFDINGRPLPYTYDAFAQQGVRYNNSKDYIPSMELNAKIQYLNKTIYFLSQQLSQAEQSHVEQINLIRESNEEETNLIRQSNEEQINLIRESNEEEINLIRQSNEEQMNQLRFELEIALSHISEIYSTFSWKITEPLRKIRTFIKR